MTLLSQYLDAQAFMGIHTTKPCHGPSLSWAHSEELGQVLMDLGADGSRAVLPLLASLPHGDDVVCVHLVERHVQRLCHLLRQLQSQPGNSSLTLDEHKFVLPKVRIPSGVCHPRV